MNGSNVVFPLKKDKSCSQLMCVSQKAEQICAFRADGMISLTEGLFGGLLPRRCRGAVRVLGLGSGPGPLAKYTSTTTDSGQPPLSSRLIMDYCIDLFPFPSFPLV